MTLDRSNKLFKLDKVYFLNENMDGIPSRNNNNAQIISKLD